MGCNDTLAKNQIKASGKKQSSRQDLCLCIVYLLSFLIIYNALAKVDFPQREGLKSVPEENLLGYLSQFLLS